MYCLDAHVCFACEKKRGARSLFILKLLRKKSDKRLDGPKVVNTEYFCPHYDLKMKRDTPAQKTFLFLITCSSYNTLPQIFERSLSLVLSSV